MSFSSVNLLALSLSERVLWIVFDGIDDSGDVLSVSVFPVVFAKTNASRESLERSPIRLKGRVPETGESHAPAGNSNNPVFTATPPFDALVSLPNIPS